MLVIISTLWLYPELILIFCFFYSSESVKKYTLRFAGKGQTGSILVSEIINSVAVVGLQKDVIYF